MAELPSINYLTTSQQSCLSIKKEFLFYRCKQRSIHLIYPMLQFAA